MNSSSKIILNTPNGEQKIYFGKPDNYSSYLENYDQVLIVTDRRVRGLEKVEETIDAIASTHPHVHEYLVDINNYTKNTSLMMSLLDLMGHLGVSRKSIIIAVGGGATADLVGVTASMFMRGIDYGVIATSYISMADGIIAKVAINHGASKNLIGAFYSPRWIIADIDFVASDDTVKISHGLVEIWKHALIENDEQKINEIERILSSNNEVSGDDLSDLGKWSMQTKAKYVLSDWEDSKNLHKSLSLGHTLANTLEMNDKIHHAEAVLYGIMFEAIISKQRSLVTESKYNQIICTSTLFEDHFKKLATIQRTMNVQSILNDLKKDKINTFGSIRFVLPTQNGFVVDVVSEEEIINCLQLFKNIRLTVKQKVLV